jgi:hypothetical protein
MDKEDHGSQPRWDFKKQGHIGKPIAMVKVKDDIFSQRSNLL